MFSLYLLSFDLIIEGNLW